MTLPKEEMSFQMNYSFGDSMMKRLIRRLFGWKDGYSISFFVLDFLFKKVLRHNHRVPWPIHFTSQVVCPERVKFGKGFWPGDSMGVYIQANNGVEIGDYTNIAPGVGLISANHDPLDNSRHVPGKPIKIGSHCWIGMNAVILPEVELGDYVIVGAGAVVTKSFPGHVVIAGNPARIIRNLAKLPDSPHS